ncbi:MAG: hypothetical protein AAF533_27080 [Acidobacteriota bacterium]
MTSSQLFRLGAVSCLVFGALFAAAALFPPVRAFTTPVLDGLFLRAPSEPDRTFLVSGIAGALLTGWGVMLLDLARRLQQVDGAAVLLAAERGLWAWFVIDSAASIATGAALNVIGNLMFVAVLIWPARRWRRSLA